MSEHDGLQGRAAHARSARLLAQGNYGSIKACGTGCIHVTFSAVSLHFRLESEFERFAIETLGQMDAARNLDAFRLLHRGTTVLLDPPNARALECLLREGIAAVHWFRGEFEFSDRDFQNLVDCQA